MLKIQLAVIFVFCLFSLTGKAQNTSNIGIGPEISFPSGNFSNLSGIGLGASLKGNVAVSSTFAISLNAGYMNFFGRNNSLVQNSDLTFIPLKIGLKYFLAEGFYTEGQLGAALPTTGKQETSFAWSPGIGNLFRLNGKNKLDLGVRYEAWLAKNNTILLLNSTRSYGFIGFRLAYVFGF